MSITHKILYSVLRKKIKVNFCGDINYQVLRKGKKQLSKFSSRNRQIIKIQNAQSLKIFDSENPDTIIIYLHGGAYVEGVNGMHVNLCKNLIKPTKSLSYILDYRLAPEYSYKEAHEDVLALYHYVKENHHKKSIVIIGDSAGGGLALSFVMSLRENGLELPKKIVLISPWLDISMSNENLTEENDEIDPILSKEGLKSAGNYYRKDLDDRNYLVSPLYGLIDSLPPILMISSTHDILQFDADSFYEKAKTKDLNIDYIKYNNVPHDFAIIPFAFKETKIAVNKIVEFIRE